MDKVIEIKNVTKSFKRKELYNNINLEIYKGDSIGIIGSNGSGKSVLFKIITGLEEIDNGEVFIRNERIGDTFDFPANVGLLVNQPGYLEYQTGLENLLSLASIQKVVSKPHIESIMEDIGLDPSDNTKVRNYSTGMRQKLGIVQAIMEKQDIILLDEPFNALDFKTNKDIIKILKRLKQVGKTLIMTSHQHEYLDILCDKLYLIEANTLVELTPDLKQKYFSLFLIEENE